MFGPDRRLARSKQQRTANDVFQLADIARPLVGPQHRQRAVGQPRDRLALGVMTQDHREGERGDIARALCQRVERHRKHVEPIEQIFAETACGDFRRKIAVGACDDADVDLDRGGRTDRDDFAFLQGAQKFGLQGQRHLGDFVEQQRAAVGSAEEAFARGVGAGEGAFLVAEQQRFQHRFGNGGTVDRNERLFGPGAALMDELRQHLLAGAGRPVDQHWNIGLRQPVGERDDRQRYRIGRNRAAICAQKRYQCGDRRLARGIVIPDRAALAGKFQPVGLGAFEHDRAAMMAAFRISRIDQLYRSVEEQRGSNPRQPRCDCPVFALTARRFVNPDHDDPVPPNSVTC